MEDDKEKSGIDKSVDTVTAAVGDVAPSTNPKAEPDPEGVSGTTNEQGSMRMDADGVAPPTGGPGRTASTFSCTKETKGQEEICTQDGCRKEDR
jgi:hypothetical protein